MPVAKGDDALNILIIGITGQQQIGNADYFIKALKKKEYHVETFNSLQAPKWRTIESSNLLGRISLPLGKNIPIEKVIRGCKKKPDLVIEVDGYQRHLSGYERVDIPTIFYGIDTHLVYNFHKSIVNDFNYVFIAQKDYIPLLKGAKKDGNVFWLPLAADPEIHRKFDVPKLFDIGYVGNLDTKRHPVRTKLLNELSKKYDVLAAQSIFGENMAKLYSLSKIGFNKSIRGDLNMRVFEVISCGTMLLTDKIGNGLSDFFEDRKHLILYEDDNGLYESVQYYLENEKECEKIAEQGRKEVHDNHTYDKRIDQMLNAIKL